MPAPARSSRSRGAGGSQTMTASPEARVTVTGRTVCAEASPVRRGSSRPCTCEAGIAGGAVLPSQLRSDRKARTPSGPGDERTLQVEDGGEPLGCVQDGDQRAGEGEDPDGQQAGGPHRHTGADGGLQRPGEAHGADRSRDVPGTPLAPGDPHGDVGKAGLLVGLDDHAALVDVLEKAGAIEAGDTAAQSQLVEEVAFVEEEVAAQGAVAVVVAAEELDASHAVRLAALDRDAMRGIVARGEVEAALALRIAPLGEECGAEARRHRRLRTGAGNDSEANVLAMDLDIAGADIGIEEAFGEIVGAQAGDVGVEGLLTVGREQAPPGQEAAYAERAEVAAERGVAVEEDLLDAQLPAGIDLELEVGESFADRQERLGHAGVEVAAGA